MKARRIAATLVLASTLVMVGASTASAFEVDPTDPPEVGEVVARGRDPRGLIAWRFVLRERYGYVMELRSTDAVRRGYSCVLDDPRTPATHGDGSPAYDWLVWSNGGASRLHRDWPVEATHPNWGGRWDLPEWTVGTTVNLPDPLDCRARPGDWDGLAWFQRIRDGGAA